MSSETKDNNHPDYIDKIAQGLRLHQEGKFMEAEQLYREILELNPDDRTALQQLLDGSRLMRG